jgi:hypothetical protein
MSNRIAIALSISRLVATPLAAGIVLDRKHKSLCCLGLGLPIGGPDEAKGVK